MIYLLNFLIVFSLVIISYQDFKFKAVVWYFFPLIFILTFYKGIVDVGIKELFKYFFINLGIIIFQMLALSIYFSVKTRAIINIINKHIGLGDLLFFIVLCTAFSPINFVIFILLNLVLITLTYGIIMIFKSLQNIKIPLAGFMSLMFACLIILESIFKNINCFDDTIVGYWVLFS